MAGILSCQRAKNEFQQGFHINIEITDRIKIGELLNIYAIRTTSKIAFSSQNYMNQFGAKVPTQFERIILWQSFYHKVERPSSVYAIRIGSKLYFEVRNKWYNSQLPEILTWTLIARCIDVLEENILCQSLC